MSGQSSDTSSKEDFKPIYKYRIYLKDKFGCGFTVDHPEEFLSKKSIERRKRQHLSIDESDLPVSKKYLKDIRKTGVQIVHTSKWNNTVLVQTTDTTQIDKVNALSFVMSTRKVATYQVPRNAGNKSRSSLIDSTYTASVTPEARTWGEGWSQIHLFNGDFLHENGFRGEGITIGIIDGGFLNTDMIPMLSNVTILGTKDFATENGDVYAYDRHGTMVLSCIASNHPQIFVGTAPEASFYLLRSEDGDSEQLVEEDNWCAAIEYADSVGVDIVNSSLGYTLFDNPADNVSYREQDGHTHLNSRSASMASSKGMIVCNSAGNSGNNQWKRIGVPADADHILAVGALTSSGKNTNFSSVGNSADGRVKPDICAMGEHCTVISSNGRLTYANGTSFASPILCGMVACYWQAHREMSAEDVLKAIRALGDRHDFPDNVYGHGIPDFRKSLPQ